MGTLLGFGVVFRGLRGDGAWGAGYAAPGQMFDGLMQALYTAAVGIGIAAFCYAAYNYLVHRVNLIVLDMEKASREAVRLALGDPGSPGEPGRNP
jgi:biopolymer transport protein ExbB/TolQ